MRPMHREGECTRCGDRGMLVVLRHGVALCEVCRPGLKGPSEAEAAGGTVRALADVRDQTSNPATRVRALKMLDQIEPAPKKRAAKKPVKKAAKRKK